MDKKQIILTVLLLFIIVGAVFVITTSTKRRTPEVGRGGSNTTLEGETTNNTEKKEVTKSELDDGTLYATSEDIENPEVVLTDNYFDTTVADINTNFSTYEGKTIQLEGMYLTNNNMSFVGRFSTSNLCASCPQGYSYLEYELNADDLPNLKNEKDWIKVKGTLKRGNGGADFYYIDVASLEVMKEKGQETVSN